MSRVFSTAADHLDVTSCPITDVPLAGCAWVKDTGFGNAAGKQVFNAGQAATGNNSFRCTVSSTDLAIAQTTDNASVSSTATGAALSEGNRWYLLSWNFGSSTNREIYINGALSASNATARAITPPLSAMRISGSLAGSQPFVGLIAHVALWSNTLSATDHANLMLFTPDKVQRGLLVEYWPLTGGQSPEPSLVSADSMTVTGTTVSQDNPLFPAVAGICGSFIGVMP
jgi:hypothetical protein